MEKKPSSVEWLAEQRLQGVNLDDALEQAKAMHKEEMKESYREGRTDQQSSSDSFYNRNAESYYNEKFGGEDEH